jgi:hypothetical protein
MVLPGESEARAGVDAAGARQAFGGANGAPKTKVTARECLVVEYGEESATRSVRGNRRKGWGLRVTGRRKKARYGSKSSSSRIGMIGYVETEWRK